ncbi:TIGR01666 family membrane protein [Muribacter muris]|uniref:TIGR01666 family membrane protein n=1 Tax=Muribacter muris TaxID=67855 RepID=A0A4Y9JYR5_9PAST|nr:YccS family putative transporter [Muribacter muris]MBF0785387.1 TIGR01666 family membrane protein [Muribacter muris]MBF0826042.1 TIGR01666 family membrane protein [Muribacter muris]TFV09647.1 TIGR01666 family membrane protein [Muribacter muris]
MNTLLKKLSFDWLNANIVGTLPIFFATNLAALSIWQLNISEHTMPLMLGIIAAGLSDLDNRLTGRLKNLFFTLVAFAISSLSAQLALSHGWLFIPLITLITFVVIMLGAIGQRYSTIAFGTLLVALYTTLSYNPIVPWYSNTLLILFGTLIYGFVAVIVYLCFPHRAVQENMAQYFEALSRYLQIKADFFDPDDTDCLPAKQFALAQANIAVMSAFDKTRVALFYRLRGQHRHLRTQKMLRYYFIGQDIWERASSSHSQYDTLFEQLKNTDLIFRFQRILELQAIACQQVATALRHNQPYQHNMRGEKVLAGLIQSLRYHQQQGVLQRHKLQSIADNLRNIEGQLAQLGEDKGNIDLRKKSPPTARLIAENVSGFRNMVQAIRSQCHLGSQLFRHAVRLSIVVFLSSLMVELFAIEQGYWILLTAVLVCQPNYSATKKRLTQRVIGTVLGVIVGLSFRYLSPTLEAQLGILVASSSLFFFFRSNNYSFSTFFITIQVLVSFDVVGLDPNGAMLPRIFDTLIGVGIAWFGVAYLWPDWRFVNLHNSLRETLKASAHYLRHIVAQLQFGYRDQFSYRVARRAAQNAVTGLSTAVSNMAGEPKKYRQPLEFAPTLLGLSYTLLSYISALGSQRTQSESLNHHIDFAAVFFKQGKQIAKLLDNMAKGVDCNEQKILAIDTQLQTFEAQYQHCIDEQSLVLLQQLRLIVQMLPQLWHFVEQEKHYNHHKKQLTPA